MTSINGWGCGTVVIVFMSKALGLTLRIEKRERKEGKKENSKLCKLLKKLLSIFF